MILFSAFGNNGWFFLGGHRPYANWGQSASQPDHIWLNGEPVDWASLRSAGLGSTAEPTMGSENILILYKPGYIGDYVNATAGKYICEYSLV